MVIRKSPREITLMKEAGRVVGLVFKNLQEAIKPGMSTLEIDAIVEKTMLDNHCTPAEKGYYGYPASACVSVNDTLIHGIPSDKIILKEGDIVSVDIVANYKGYMADACRTYKVGTITDRAFVISDNIHADNIAFPKDNLTRRNTVYKRVINTDASACRISIISFFRWCAVVI